MSWRRDMTQCRCEFIIFYSVAVGYWDLYQSNTVASLVPCRWSISMKLMLRFIFMVSSLWPLWHSALWTSLVLSISHFLRRQKGPFILSAINTTINTTSCLLYSVRQQRREGDRPENTHQRRRRSIRWRKNDEVKLDDNKNELKSILKWT